MIEIMHWFLVPVNAEEDTRQFSLQSKEGVCRNEAST
jgi:hypothetical protein